MRIAVLGGAAFLLVTLTPPVRADWQVRRTGNEGVVAQTERLLEARPDDYGVAVRLVKLASKATIDRVLVTLGERAATQEDRPDALLAYAQLLRATGRAPEAATVFERISKAMDSPPSSAPRPPRGPLRLATYLGWAETLRASGDHAKAIAAYWSALEIEKRPQQRRQLLQIVLFLAAEVADVEQELAARRALTEVEPSSDAATLALVDVLARVGRPDEGAQILDEKISGLTTPQRRSRVAILLRAAALHEMAGDTDGAGQILAGVLQALPVASIERRRDVWGRVVEIARRRGTLPALAKSLERADAPHGPAEWESLSEIRDELGDLEGALEAARRATRLEPRNLDIGRRVAALLDRLGRKDEVTAELALLARLASSEPRFTFDLIERQFRLGGKEEARQLFDRALKRFASNTAALGQLASLAARWSESHRAIEAWTRLLRLSPRDEMAILGLGEEQFQARNKDQALHTWQALREGRSPKADGCARLAEVLIEHDLLEDATAEVVHAETLEPKEPRHRRLMAQILERQRRPEAAVAEWERVLAMNTGAKRVAERREARSRILGILSREGRARLDDKVRRLRADLSRNPDDRETALFLAEAALRSDDLLGAIETLRATVTRDRQRPVASPETGEDAKVEVMLTLVRLLRQTRQLDEAVQLLNELAQRSPSRAREAHIQIADIELARYEDRKALEHASSAARLTPDDGHVLIRVAEVQERAGEIEAALTNYRRAFARDSNPAAAFALARLLARRGSTREAAEILRSALRAASDEETITETGRRAIDMEEFLGTLGDLERVVAGLVFSTQNGSAYRRLLVDIYRRLLPTLYRAPLESTAASENRSRIAQHGLRPLLELATDGDGDPERGIIELLGMLGNRDAAPALARLAQGPAGLGGESLLRGTAGASSDVQLTAIIALGRLADVRGRAVLESLLTSSDASVRVASVWALGRIGLVETGDLLAANTNSHLDVAGFAYLGLGRTRDPRWRGELTRAALEPSLPTKLRRAAAIALGLSGSRAGIPSLLTLLDAGNVDLARAAAAALGALGDAEILPPLFERALSNAAPLAGSDAPALAGIDRFVRGLPLEDDAKAIEGVRLDLDAMLAVLASPPTQVDRTSAWLTRTRDIERILRDLLAGDHAHRIQALEALDSRDDGPGLGPLAPTGRAALSPPTVLALREIGSAISGRVLALVGDASPEVRALAIRVATKIDDSRMTPSMILAALGDGQDSPRRVEDAASFALTRYVASHPDAIPALARRLASLLSDSTSWERRITVVGMLACLGGAAVPALEGSLKDESPFVRSAAITAFARAGGSAAVLATSASDSIPAVRASAARALSHQRDPTAMAALARLRRDPSDLVRSTAANIEP